MKALRLSAAGPQAVEGSATDGFYVTPVGDCPFLDGGSLMSGPGTIRVGNECVPDNGDAGDAGDSAEGGPLEPVTGCNGTCVPIARPDWLPVLLWTGTETSAPSCQDLGLEVIFDGTEDDADSTFGLACSSNASGPCPGPLDTCGPLPVAGFLPCVMHDGNDVACAGDGPYPDWSVFEEGVFPEPSAASTFCCAPAPIMPP
jgi:hypothetical protein